ncbi:hypothetical protein [Agromyces allii]|uniref:Uncharacterized protein n=1 Tax=Agromyces allii TaxID=393607 RepID=A0ABN2QT78_9MICO|nr:hypothetical protein [Agromyces allii]
MPRRLPTERQAWGAGLIVAGIGVLLWLGCLFMMVRVGWDLSMEVGSGGGGRNGGVRVPAGVALAILGLLGLGCVALGGLVTRNALRDIRDES